MIGTTPNVDAAEAALSLTPSNGIYPIGEAFEVDVRIDTGGSDIGSADMSLVYDPADMEYVAVSDEGSIFSTLLVDSDTSPGRIELSGFIARGRATYSGSDGHVAQLTFVPLRNVATEVRFASGSATPPLSLTASVGDLTNVLTNLRAATYTLVPRESVAPAAVVYAQEAEGFEITPLPVPDHEWFATTSVKLSWTLPDSVVEMRTTVSDDPNATPDTNYPIPLTSVELTELAEGQQFFMLQFKYGDSWGNAIRYPIAIDSTGPSHIVLKEEERQDESDPRVGIAIEASDELSGIGYYEIGIDGAQATLWERPANGIYIPDDLSPGEHVLTVTAYDRAGNSTSTDLLFLVRSLDPPVLVDAPDHVLTGDSITVRGTTYPNAEVTVYTSYDDGEASEHVVRSDDAGGFVATLTEGARAGKYTVSFKVTDERGAASPVSIKRSINVKQPYIMLYGNVAVTYLSVLVPLLALIVLLVLTLWLSFVFVRSYKRRIGRETNEVYHVVHDEFKELRKYLIQQIGTLEKANQSRELTREEMQIFTELSKRLDHIERHIQEEVDDITTVEPEVDGEVRRRSTRTADVSTPKKHTITIERT